MYSQFDKELALLVSPLDMLIIIPGCPVLITESAYIIQKGAKGLANVSTGEKMHTGMRFRIGSLTKTFTENSIDSVC